MARKSLKVLEKVYNTDSFFSYITQLVNDGNFDCAKASYNEMKPNNQKEFILHSVKHNNKKFLTDLFRAIL